MTYVLVLRDTKRGSSHIWESAHLNGVLSKAYKWMMRGSARWTDKADAFLMERYGTVPPGELVGPISRMLRRRVTKNAVIGRYHRLKRREAVCDLPSG